MKNMMRATITVCILLFLCALTSCAKTGEIIMESPETKKDHLQAEMVSFFQEHQTEMQAFALQMEELNDSDPIYDYRYAVKENALIQFDGEHIKAQGKITKHPLLSDAAFFRETMAFEWVEWLTVLFDCSGCFFAGYVYDENDTLYAELYVFYTEDEPVTDEYTIVEELAENWYYYCEYRH